MSDSPLITVVVPVYKVPQELLRHCLDSICAQTSRNFEALLIDDGSPDNCGTICDEYAARNSYMRVIHQNNGGLSVVRNNGINNARGEWVCFVDGDDWIEPNTIEYAESYVKKYPDGDVLIWDEYYDIGKEVRENLFLGEKVEGVLKYENEHCEDLIERILPSDPIPSPNTYAGIGTANARLYRRSFLIDNKIYNRPGLKRMQDTVFNLWVFDKAERVYYTSEHLYHYVMNESAATKHYTRDIVDTMYLLYECYLEFLTSTGRLAYMPRLYLRFIRIIAQCFELDYAHPDNKNPFGERLNKAQKDMERPHFQEAIRNADVTGQSVKIKLISLLLRHKQYLLLIMLTRINAMTRAFRLTHRR